MLFILSFTEEGTGIFKATILSLLLTLTGSAFAGWVDIPAPNASSSSGPLNLQFDDASVVRDSGTVSVWFRMQWAGRGTIQQYNSSFDCKNRISNVNDAFQYGPNTYPRNKIPDAQWALHTRRAKLSVSSGVRARLRKEMV